MPRQHLPPPAEPPKLAAASLSPSATVSPSPTVTRRTAGWERTRLTRVVLLSVLSCATGVWLMRALFPLLPSSAITELLEAHVAPLCEGGIAPLLVWLRLLWRRLPIPLLLAAAGLTRFSGALTTVVLTLRGLSDGAAIYCLYLLRQGTMTPPTDGMLPTPSLWLMVFGGAAVVGILLRALMATEARRLAATLSPLPGVAVETAPLTPAAVRTLLWRYAAVTLTVLVGHMLAEGAYVVLLSAIL